ncbi:hypothetical protein LAX5112_04027 [Roseibium alexandrii]|uniref:Uncharacterized protein n=1 Tax=Roseibium alexandrii TaxID=388408 RepID=A0A0M7AKC2_9HYPH|nr:hypothetical protein LAX5112_04027 [Roseibium alexandrii]
MFLAFVDQGLQHVALRREPEAVVNQLGVARHQLVFEVACAAIERNRFHGPVRLQQDRTARGLIDAAALHADKPVFDHVQAANAVVAAIVVELCEQCGRGHFFAVQRNRVTFFEADLDFCDNVRGFSRVNGALEYIVRRFLVRVFQNLSFGRRVQHVGVH